MNQADVRALAALYVAVWAPAHVARGLPLREGLAEALREITKVRARTLLASPLHADLCAALERADELVTRLNEEGWR